MNVFQSPSWRRSPAAIASVLGFVVATACDESNTDMNAAAVTQSSSLRPTPAMAIDNAVRSLSARRVYFAHQSVGRNVVDGLADLLGGRDSSLRIVKTREPASVGGPALIHFDAGRNEDPASKNADFLRMLDARSTPDQGVAMMKYCFLDVNLATDIDKLFDSYRETIRQARAKHPDLAIVHVTMPLTVDATGPKATVKRLLGRSTARDVNLKRNQFNQLLRKEFAEDGIYDIALLESTRSDGTREQATLGGQTVYALAPEYTNDGGHLTAEASRKFAEQFLKVVAAVPRR